MYHVICYVLMDIKTDSLFVLFARSVSRFQYPENRKDLIRLEKGACSYINRSIMFKGAFAVLYGQHLKCYIRDPEVI